MVISGFWYCMMEYGEVIDVICSVWVYVKNMVATLGIEGFSKIIFVICAVVGACVAVKGLDSWKKQSMWEREHEIAAKLFQELSEFKYRINKACEIPLIPEDEINREGIGRNLLDRKEVKGELVLKYVNSRWDSVDEISKSLEPRIYLAGAYWGDSVIDLISRINKNKVFLAATIKGGLEYRDKSEEKQKQYSDALKSVNEDINSIVEFMKGKISNF